MRKITLIVLLVALAAAGVNAQEKQWYFTADSTFNSQYIWHGIVFNSEPVWQPSVEVGAYGFAVNFWFNYELTDNISYIEGDGEFQFTEADMTLSYSGSYDMINYSVGYLHYTYPNTGLDGTAEVFASLGLNTALYPTFTIYRDIDQAEGIYMQFSGSHSTPAFSLISAEDSTLNLAASLGYGDESHNNFYWGLDQETALDVLLSGSLSIALSDEWSLTPAVYWSSVLTEEIRDVVENPDNFYAGISLTYTY